MCPSPASSCTGCSTTCRSDAILQILRVSRLESECEEPRQLIGSQCMTGSGPVPIESKVQRFAPGQTREKRWSEVESRNLVPVEQFLEDPSWSRRVVVGRVEVQTGETHLPTFGLELDLAWDQNGDELETELLG